MAVSLELQAPPPADLSEVIDLIDYGGESSQVLGRRVHVARLMHSGADKYAIQATLSRRRKRKWPLAVIETDMRAVRRAWRGYLHRDGEDVIAEIATQLHDALGVCAQVRNDPNVEAKVRVGAAQTTANIASQFMRLFGFPTSRVITESHETVEIIEAQLPRQRQVIEVDDAL